LLEEVYDDWCLLEREQLRRQCLETLDWLVTCYRDRGAWDQALDYCLRLLSYDPFNEAAHRAAMTLYCALGDRGAAIRQYQLCREVLARELAIEPLADTTALYERIIQGELELAPRPVSPPRLLPGPAVAPVSPGPPIQSSLVGREVEMGRLLGLWAEALRGRGQVALLEGEMGIGKTRLAEELGRLAGEEGGLFLTGRCYALEGPPPYQPVAEALRRYLKTAPRADWPALASVWVAHVGQILPELLDDHPPGPVGALSPEQERGRLFEGLARFVAGLAARRPLILFLDDLQWADEASLHLVHYLARSIVTDRVLLLAAFRTEHLADNHPLRRLLGQWARQPEVYRFALRRLSEGQVGEMIRNMSGRTTVPWLFARRLYQETAGNPLFVVELVRALFDAGVLYIDPTGGWSTAVDEITQDYGELPIPANIREAILARMQALERPSRELLAVAAAAGGPFDLPLLAAVTGWDEPGLLDRVEGLLHRQWLYELPDGWYDFSHPKVREVVYHEASQGRRRWLHARIGQTLEVRHADDLPAVAAQLAEHFDRGGDPERALRYSLVAADRARQLHANAEAIRHYSRSLKLMAARAGLPAGARRPVYERLGDVYELTGRFDLAQESYRHALADGGAGLTPVAFADLHWKIARVYEKRGEYGDAIEHLALGRAAIADTSSPGPLSQWERGSRLVLGRIDSLLGLVHVRQGRPDEAITCCRRALATLESIPPTGESQQEVSRVYNTLGLAYYAQGNYDEAITQHAQSLALSEAQGDLYSMAVSLNNLGIACHGRGDYDQAIEYHRCSLALREKIGDIYGVAASHNNLGVVYSDRGDYALAAQHYRENFEIRRSLGDRYGMAMAHHNLGEVHLLQDDLPRAVEHLREAVRLREEIGERWLLAETYSLLAQVHLAAGNADAALGAAERSLAVSSQTGDAKGQGLAHRALGEVHRQAGRLIEARRHFALSLALLESSGERIEQARTLRSDACTLATAGDRAAARQRLAEARAIFAGLGAAGELSRTDRELHRLEAQIATPT
jgi:tetratricopeptide (TPR) repeat protein